LSKCKGFNRHRWAKVGGFVACARCFQARNPAATSKSLRTVYDDIDIVRDIKTPVIPKGYVHGEKS
jgi:hypothetical protein